MGAGLNEGGSVWSMVFTGSWVALAILLILLVMSATSWAIIILKWLQLRRARAQNDHFYAYFRRGHPISKIFDFAQKLDHSPLAGMFDASYREIQAFRRTMEKSPDAQDGRERLMVALSRTLESVYNRQNGWLEKRLPFLATVSSSSPYIGLFGTVLGIIDAFRSIGTMGVTSLAVVAPGISEALVATAAGLMAAIPALIAYNFYRNIVRELNTEMKNFALDVSNRLERLL